MHRTARLLRATQLSALQPLRTSVPPLRARAVGTPTALPITSVHFRRVLSTTRALLEEKKPDEPLKYHADDQNRTSTAREELQNVSKDVAEMISGRSKKAAEAMAGATEISSHNQPGSIKEDYANITRGLFKSVPEPALYIGLAGTLPYLGTSLGTIFLAREASRASNGLPTLTGLDGTSALENLHLLEHVQITYGAIILSFLGAIHWGMEFSRLGGEQGYKRLALGVIPVLFAWPTTFLPHGMALVTQWFGFTGTWALDQRASTQGWTPHWYSTYRFYLSIIVGVSIMATFAGTGYYGAGAGATTDLKSNRHHATIRESPLKRLDRVKERNFPTKPGVSAGKLEGTVKGDIQVDENDDSYLKLRNIKAEKEEAEEERKKEEAEKAEKKKKEAEYQDKRDEYQMDIAPGKMKDTAKDRTGKNANVSGGKEERPDDAKQDRTKGVGPPGDTTELGTSEDKDSDVTGQEVKDKGLKKKGPDLTYPEPVRITLPDGQTTELSKPGDGVGCSIFRPNAFPLKGLMEVYQPDDWSLGGTWTRLSGDDSTEHSRYVTRNRANEHKKLHCAWDNWDDKSQANKRKFWRAKVSWIEPAMDAETRQARKGHVMSRLLGYSYGKTVFRLGEGEGEAYREREIRNPTASIWRVPDAISRPQELRSTSVHFEDPRTMFAQAETDMPRAASKRRSSQISNGRSGDLPVDIPHTRVSSRHAGQQIGDIIPDNWMEGLSDTEE